MYRSDPVQAEAVAVLGKTFANGGETPSTAVGEREPRVDDHWGRPARFEPDYQIVARLVAGYNRYVHRPFPVPLRHGSQRDQP